ncbi:MAG: cupin domain-containing protein [Planctomycetes bacterium]|nr:cupin domain-containing protein [Planctomycetota bacterium]
MKRYRIRDLNPKGRHILEGIVPGAHIRGGLGFKQPGERTHDKGCNCASCGGSGKHVHDDDEVFIFLEGRAVVEVDGVGYEVGAGDVIVAEAGEDHHVVADAEFPCVNLWLHGSSIPGRKGGERAGSAYEGCQGSRP